MDGQQTVRVGFGKINLKGQGATLSAFRMRPPYLRDSAASSGRSKNRWEEYPVSEAPQVNGKLYSTDVAHENGTILLIQSAWTRGGLSTRDGGIYLRLRSDAALINVEAVLPHGPDSRLGSRFCVFRGCADILSPDEAKLYQIATPHTVIDKYFDLDQVEECFDLKEIAQEVRPRPDVQLIATATGLETRETMAAPTRRFNFRR